MIKRTFLILLLTALAFSASLFAQSKVGTTAVPFLGISVTPRATALGGAFAAIANDATALYYNPGGISRATRSQFVVSHTNWLAGTSFNWVGFILNLDGANTLGVSLTQLDYGEEEVTTVEQPEGIGQKWGATDMAAALSYARNLTDRFSIGGSLKYIQQKVWNETGSAFALDIGLLFTTGFNDMKLGMSISNFGTDLQLDGKELLHKVDLDPETIGHNETIVSRLKTDAWPLPIFFRVGLAMDLVKNQNSRLTLAMDALRPSDNSETINLGSEFSFKELLFLRGGYKSLFRDDSEEGLTLGTGVQIPLGSAALWNFDYTFADFGLFEAIHMFAIGVQF